MSSIKIRQNIFNYQQKRKGFTTRQIIGAAAGLAVLIGVIAGLWIGLGINYKIAITLGFILALPCVYAGFAQIFGMNPEEAAVRVFRHLGREGMMLHGEEIDDYEGGVSRDYAKKTRREKGFECENRKPE